MLQIVSWTLALMWIPQNFTNEKLTLVQVMAWCHQATSHYLSQCWPRFISPYGITRPESVNISVTGILQASKYGSKQTKSTDSTNQYFFSFKIIVDSMSVQIKSKAFLRNCMKVGIVAYDDQWPRIQPLINFNSSMDK